jgi:hypothetical protein
MHYMLHPPMGLGISCFNRVTIWWRGAIGGGGVTRTDEAEIDKVALEGEVPDGLWPTGAVRPSEEEEQTTKES